MSAVLVPPAPTEARIDAPPGSVAALPADAVERARALAAEFAALAAQHDRSGAPPAEQFARLQEAGLLRAPVERRFGGDGAGLAVSRAIVGEIAYGDPSVALILAMHYSQHSAIARATAGRNPEWPAALAERLAREAAAAPALINAAQVEPELGSPSHGGLPATVARRVGAHWRLSGHKRYVTGVPLLSWINVLAITDEPEPRLGHFLVPRAAPGVVVIESWDPLGMRATASHDVVLSDVAIPLDDAAGLRPAHLGMQRDPLALAWYFSLVSAVYDGAARAARDWLLDFLNERRPGSLGGAPLASVASVQEQVGRIETWLAANAWLMSTHAHHIDSGDAPPALGAVVKQTVIENAKQAVTLAVALAGNHGIARANALERHQRNVLCSGIHAPTNPLLRANLGRDALAAAAARKKA
ncbi:acyl-CoA dehydrogenase family protein [Burkholderia gladioli]|uniref:acyl-CoA dehydrogenase family protein n=1 Tax=Burkholderia gladioli TaxID=28095 RepID=UPI0016414374|nr:acyl-CoA dehydrogenase family protein [Burkholderia gladioli]